jgi:DNA-binding transcriptional LysR family regulator
MINSLWLKTFKTLVELGHFTQTANKLFMTQPGVTQHIKKLEEACGTALLKRHNKTFELTEQGRILYEYAIEQQNNEQRLFEKLNFDDPNSGVCRLACSGSLALKLYPLCLNQQVQYPGLNIELEVSPNRNIIELVSNQKIDLGFVTQIPDKSKFDTLFEIEDELLLILHHGSLLAWPEQPLSELLNSIGMMKHPDAEHYLRLYCERSNDPSLKQLNYDKLSSRGYINQLTQILTPVSQGLGFTVLPKTALDHWQQTHQANPFDIFEEKSKSPVLEKIYCIKKRHRPLAKRIDHLLKAITTGFGAKLNGL